MTSFTFQAKDETATSRLGAALAEILPDATVVAMHGTLGAGKTRLVQAVAAASGVPPQTASSPTFVLVHEYQGRRPIYHFDTYRLRDEDEFRELGPEEYFAGPGISLIEWAERVESCLPDERVEIRIEVTGETARQFTVSGTPEYADVVAGLRDKLGAGVKE